MKKTILAAALTAASMAATAEPYNYFSAGLSMQTYEEDFVPDFNPKGLDVGFGRQFNENFSGEIRLSLGFADDTNTLELYDYNYGYFTEQGTLNVDYIISALVKPTYPVNDKFNVYAIAGVSKTKLNFELGGYELSTSETELTIGAGFRYAFNETSDFIFEYIKYGETEAAELSGLTIGLRKNFK